MKKFGFGVTLVLILGAGIYLFKSATAVNSDRDAPTAEKSAVDGYWTCAMHPQIHMDHQGECPICHMKLIHVKGPSQKSGANDDAEIRATVVPTVEQMKLLGIQKSIVEKMDLKVKIPVYGRFISSSSIAFQIYESDLRYIRSGLNFSGESSSYPEEEIFGVISSVDSIVDSSSRTVRVIGSVKSGPAGKVSETGFRGEIEFVLKDRIAIPESAVLHTGAQDLVYVFGAGNELSPKVVKLGLKTEGFYDLLGGLEIGQSISSGPNFLIDSEAKIRGL